MKKKNVQGLSDAIDSLIKERVRRKQLRFLDNLEYAWTARVRLHNDLVITIWWTALPMMKPSIAKVISVSSDYPKFKINNQ